MYEFINVPVHIFVVVDIYILSLVCIPSKLASEGRPAITRGEEAITAPSPLDTSLHHTLAPPFHHMRGVGNQSYITKAALTPAFIGES